ncbi:vitamin B6 photo-protection and homoeostasis-domain-containing protein [Plectosphaerella plurivora]|uniref:Vitamin B6 photo-protection and homoeostasis-domain-containing protein n=1 Tax=Plectosphaerella plurivora TaxID=936078 RepID=A0A9P9AHP4_9PEZI|nr:vitamin B6 photo-protection and homoeostasis-domain-containing protein [Plectosphaerella plurivora]
MDSKAPRRDSNDARAAATSPAATSPVAGSPTSDPGKPKLITDYHTSEQDVIIEERDKSDKQVIRRWLHRADSSIYELPIDANSSLGFSFRNLRQMAIDAFLPIGFPHSVSPDYLEYQLYDSLQAFFSTITSLLANRAILQGLGVGDASTTATYALLLTILQDAISRVATIVFAYRFGLAIEPDAKRFRYLADVFNDTAFFLDLASPYLNTWSKILALTAAAALRALCGVAAGASKAALSSHFARSNNLAELNAKEASQETAVGLCGLFFGSILVNFVERRETVFSLMIFLVFVHLYMNYRGVRCVQLNTLNQQRATLVMQHYFATGGEIPSPSQVAEQESIVFWTPKVISKHGHVGAYLAMAKSYADMASTWNERCGYIISWKGKAGQIPQGKIILTKLDQGIKARAAIKAWYEGVATGWEGRQLDWNSEKLAEREVFIRRAQKAGWNVDENCLETGIPFRVSVRSTVNGREDKKEQ